MACPCAQFEDSYFLEAGSKKQGTAMERAVLQQYLAARRGRGSYAASNLLRRGRIPGTDSAAQRSPAKTGAQP